MGRGVRAATDGTNSAVRAGGFAAGKDAAGNKAAGVRGGYADSSGYRQGGSVTARQNQWGYTKINARGGYGNGNGTGAVGSRAAIRGPAGNVVTTGRGASFVNGQFVGGKSWTAVNGNYTRWGYFGPGYINRYPGAWWPGKWSVYGTAWAVATWATVGPYCGYSDEGYYYDYGENVTYSDGSVYYGDEEIATSEEYYDEAAQIADAGEETTDEDWMPLGVFSLITEANQTDTKSVLQLAVNREGAIRGNWQDLITNDVKPLVGSVDKKNQRVAIKMKGNDSVVLETGLYNLTNDEAPAIIHTNAKEQKDVTLVRLNNPDEDKK